MAYKNRTTTTARSGGPIASGGYLTTAQANSSEIPPHTAVVTATITTSQTALIMSVEGKMPDSSYWVHLKYMVSATDPASGGAAVPGTDGVADGSITTFTAEVPAYPRMRCRFKSGGLSVTLGTCWITS